MSWLSPVISLLLGFAGLSPWFSSCTRRQRSCGLPRGRPCEGNLTVELKKQQTDDNSKKEYCEDELDKAEDKKNGLAQAVSDLESAIDDDTSIWPVMSLSAWVQGN